MYGLVLNTAAAVHPISVAEATKQIGVPEGDAYIEDDVRRLIPAAVELVQQRTGRQLVNATWDLRLDHWPCGLDPILIPRNPLSSVTSITYSDTSGNSQTLATTVYMAITSREPGEIRLKNAQSWPSLYGQSDVIVVRFVAGYGAAASSVPETLKRACLLQLQILWDDEHREDTTKANERLDHLLNTLGVGDEFHAYSR